MSDQNSSTTNTLPFLDDRTLDRFITGECAPGEQLRVEQWLARNEPDQKVVDAIREDALLAWNTEPNPDANAAFNRIVETPITTPARPQDRQNHPRPWWNGIAIGIAGAIIICAVGINHFLSTHSIQSITKVYSTAPGQRVTVTLSSGAQVVLAPGTTLRTNANDVMLSGQAVFTVPHSSSAPFIVRTQKATIRVLGTTFSVQAYTSNTLIAVAEGKVSVNSGIISSGDMVSVSENGATRITHDANISSEFAWTTGRLVFDETPFAAIARDIERWYDMDIRITDKSLALQLVTITLDATSRDRSLASLAAVLGAKTERSGRTVTFKRK